MQLYLQETVEHLSKSSAKRKGFQEYEAVYDFSDAVKNDHPQHPEEILYIFGKDINLMPRYGDSEEKVSLYIKFNKLTNQYVIVISFHKQEYPLTYKFK